MQIKAVSHWGEDVNPLHMRGRAKLSYIFRCVVIQIYRFLCLSPDLIEIEEFYHPNNGRTGRRKVLVHFQRLLKRIG